MHITSLAVKSGFMRPVLFILLLTISGCYSGETEKYTVAVDMSAEYKEGRFQPQSGDYVTLAGNFNDWNKDELILKSEPGSRIYATAIDQCLMTNDFTSDTLRFKFIHHSGDGRQIANQGWEVVENRDLIIPNKGWESTPNRFLQIDSSKVFADYVDFDNIKSVVRFIVNTKELEKSGKFKPYEGDILQIKITADRKSYFSDELIKTARHIFETSLELPLTIDKINYAVMVNRKEIAAGGKNEIIPINGRIIKIN